MSDVVRRDEIRRAYIEARNRSDISQKIMGVKRDLSIIDCLHLDRRKYFPSEKCETAANAFRAAAFLRAQKNPTPNTVKIIRKKTDQILCITARILTKVQKDQSNLRIIVIPPSIFIKYAKPDQA